MFKKQACGGENTVLGWTVMERTVQEVRDKHIVSGVQGKGLGGGGGSD